LAFNSFGVSSSRLISWSYSLISSSFSNFFLLNKWVNGWMYSNKSSRFVRSVSWYAWTLIFFLIWFLFLFYFLDNEEACDCSHMMCHMTLYHRPKIWEKGLEGWYQDTCQQHVHFIVYILCTHGWYMDFREGLFTIAQTMNHLYK